MRPFDFFVDLLHPQLDFLPRALAVSVVAAVVCAVVGTHVVLRGNAFVGEAVAHAVFPGIAVSVLLGGSVLVGGAVAGVMTAVLFTLAAQSRRVTQDSAIGICFVAAFALGLVLLSRARGYTGSLEGFLFGSVMSVPAEELPVLTALGAVLVAVTAWLTPTFLTVALDRESARAQGLPVVALDLALNLLVTLAIVMSVHVVGNILVVALLVAAPATARLCTDRWRTMLVLGPAVGALAALIGLWAAWTWDVPAGAAIVLAAAALFLVALVVGPRHGLLAVRRTRPRVVRSAGGDGTGTASRRLSARARGLGRAGAAVAVVGILLGGSLAGVVAGAPGAAAAEPPARRALHHTHVDATHLHWDDERGLRLDLIEGLDTLVPADDVVIDVQEERYEGVDVSKLTVPEPREGRDLSFLGTPGTTLWNAPQSLYGDWKPVWVGIGAGEVPASRADITALRIHLVDVQGPGDVEVFSMNATGVQRAFSSKDPAHSSFAVAPHAHGHFNWTFSEPGTYTLSFEGRGRDPRTGGDLVSNRSKVVFRVGPPSAQTEAPPVGPESQRHPGGTGIAPGTSVPGPVDATAPPSASAPGTTTPGPGGPRPGAPTPSTGAGPAPGASSGSGAPSQCRTLTVGHIDMAVRGGASGLEAVLKDETRGAAVLRRPQDVTVGVTDALAVRVPAGFEKVGAAGTTLWMIPQVQNPGGIWSGFNTQAVDYSALDGPVHVELAGVTGPGRVVLFQEDLLRGVQVMWDSAPGGRRSFAMGVPSHVHHALAFSAPGRYELELRYRARTESGRTVTASARYTFLVGGAALAADGCGGAAPGGAGAGPGSAAPGSAQGQAPAGTPGADAAAPGAGVPGPAVTGVPDTTAAEASPGVVPALSSPALLGATAATPVAHAGGAGAGATHDGEVDLAAHAGVPWSPDVSVGDVLGGTPALSAGVGPPAAVPAPQTPGTPGNPVLAAVSQNPEVVLVTGTSLALLVSVLLWLAARGAPVRSVTHPAEASTVPASTTEGNHPHA